VVIEIRERVARGIPQAIVADDVGVTHTAISQIVNGLAYAHLGGPLTFSKPRKKGRFVGVRVRSSGKWLAQIGVEGKLRHLGTFDDEVSAALAYNAAIIAHGLNRPLNVIPVVTAPSWRRF
jgi:hypothetical protein